MPLAEREYMQRRQRDAEFWRDVYGIEPSDRSAERAETRDRCLATIAVVFVVLGRLIG